MRPKSGSFRQLHTMDDRSNQTKVAIPRLERPENNHKPTHNQAATKRVPKACSNCRSHKVRCSGEQPRCQNCARQSVPCTYLQARRDRLKDAAEHIDKLVAFIKDLSVHVDDRGKRKIDELLGSLGEYSSATSTASHIAKEWSMGRFIPIEEGQDLSPEADVSGSLSFNDDVDLVDEDLFRSHKSRATGFVGQNSEVQWLRNLKNKMESPERAGPANWLPYGPPGSSNGAAAQRVDASHAQQKSSQLGSIPHISHVSDSSFYLDGEGLEMDVVVDPYELPLPEIAEALFNFYTQTIHTSFPILPDTFEQQFYKYNESVKQGRPYQLPESWRAILNLVLAIGEQYSHLAQTGWCAHERDHVLYMTRAVRMLGLDSMAASPAAPTLPLIQATGLLSLYYLTVGQVSRAWMTIGTSLRFALTVGLHLRNDDPSAPPSKKEDLVRTWWSLHSIESLLCTLIGRPCVISNHQCTVPLPHVLPDELASPKDQDGKNRQSNMPTRNALSNKVHTDTVSQASFLGTSVTMSIIVEKALSRLYSPQTSVNSWKQIQKEIDALSKELDEWAATALPAGLRPMQSIQKSRVRREQLLLSFQYHSAKLLIYRPCLCRLEQHIAGQSDASANFHQRTAATCVQAAQAITGLLPDEPNLAFVYEQSPWWCIVHNIMQATAVFLLEMSFGQAHITHPDKGILESTRKLVRWLQCIGVGSAVARRAYEIIVGIIDTGAQQLQIDKSDVFTEGVAGQSHSFHAHQWPQSTEIPPNHGASFSYAEWDRPSYINPASTTDLGTQHPTTLWGRHPAQGFGKFQTDQYFMPDLNPQMPSVL